MNFNLKNCLIMILFYNFLIIMVESLDVNDNSDEVEIYKHLFAKLNKVIDEIDLVQQNMESLENQMKNFEIKLDESAITITSTQSTITSTQSNKESLVEEPKSSSASSDLYCFNENWSLVQNHADGTKKIYRDWKDVEAAVGNKSNKFLAGLEKLYRLASLKPEDISVKIKSYDNARRNIPKSSIDEDVYNDIYDLNEY